MKKRSIKSRQIASRKAWRTRKRMQTARALPNPFDMIETKKKRTK
jgi:hypothetical protein